MKGGKGKGDVCRGQKGKDTTASSCEVAKSVE